MIDPHLLAFVRAGLPEPPARLLEIGAGDGELARALAASGYEVVAIDPAPGGAGVVAVALHELAQEVGTFDAALAVTSLHHVEPLEASLSRLAETLAPGAVLVVDEFDVGALDVRAAEWWLSRRGTAEGAGRKSAEDVVAEHRAHLHPLERIVAALEADFRVESPRSGPYLYRWGLDPAFRSEEEDAIARGEIPATGARLLARRR